MTNYNDLTIGANIFMGSEAIDSDTMAVIGAGIVLTGYVLSIIDTNLSAKKSIKRNLNLVHII